MKIAYISHSLIPSRTANSLHVMKMCQALAQLGHQVTLIAINNSREIEPGIIDIYHFYNVEKTFDVIKPTYLSVRGKSFFYAPAALRVLQKIQPDLVYGRLIPGCYLQQKTVSLQY